MKLKIIIKILDFVHDLLCPFFRDDVQKTEKTDKKVNKK